MKMTATHLRSQLYTVLDQVAESGEPVHIERKGKLIQIALVEPEPPQVFRWDSLVARPERIVGDGDISDLDWTTEWSAPVSSVDE